MNANPPDRPLSEEELERLFDEAVREVRAARAVGADPDPHLPPELLEELKPSIEALRKIFDKRAGRK